MKGCRRTEHGCRAAFLALQKRNLRPILLHHGLSAQEQSEILRENSLQGILSVGKDGISFRGTGLPLQEHIEADILGVLSSGSTGVPKVIIKNNRIVAATCYLPLTDRTDVNKELGTRHRAGLGISEATDSMTIIVSEETGSVSIAHGGVLYRNLDENGIRTQLEKIQDKPEDRPVKSRKLKKGGRKA